MVGTSDAPAQLMELCKPELIRPIDDDGIGARHVDAALDDRRTDEQVAALMVKVEHDLFEFALAHLPMTDGNARFRNEFRNRLRSPLDCFDTVVHVVDLSAAPNFAQTCIAHGRRLPLSDK